MILDDITNRVEERRRRWHHMELDFLPPYQGLQEVAIIGAFSICTLTTRYRMLLERKLLPVVPGLRDTPSALARDYLMLKYKRSPHIITPQKEVVTNDDILYMPIVATPGSFKLGYYIDIAATYWQIMNIVGWDLDYYPGEWLARGRPPEDFPFADNKTARNCLVSAGLGNDVTMFVPGEGIKSVHKGNVLSNLQLYRLIVDVLQAIASEAVSVGAIYVNTDGYIVTTKQSASALVQAIADWGLEARIKYEGPGSIKGPGDYHIGRHKSRAGLAKPTYMFKVREVEHKAWLKKRFEILATNHQASRRLGGYHVTEGRS